MEKKLERKALLVLRQFNDELAGTEDAVLTVESDRLRSLVDYTYALLEELGA